MPDVPRAARRPQTGNPALRWLRANLFSSIPNGILTFVLLAILAKGVFASCNGASRTPCGSPRRTIPAPAARCAASAPAGPIVPEKVPLHPVRHLSVRRAVAAGAGGHALHRAVLALDPAQLCGGKELCLALDRGAGADRPADVGRRRSASAFVSQDRWGRAAGDTDPRDLWPGVRLSARHSGRARPPFEAAGDPLAQRALCRTDPRRAADQPAVHGERDVSAVHARAASTSTNCCARRSRSSCLRGLISPKWCAAACRRCRAEQYEAADALGLSYWRKKHG